MSSPNKAAGPAAWGRGLAPPDQFQSNSDGRQKSRRPELLPINESGTLPSWGGTRERRRPREGTFQSLRSDQQRSLATLSCEGPRRPATHRNLKTAITPPPYRRALTTRSCDRRVGVPLPNAGKEADFAAVAQEDGEVRPYRLLSVSGMFWSVFGIRGISPIG